MCFCSKIMKLYVFLQQNYVGTSFAMCFYMFIVPSTFPKIADLGCVQGLIYVCICVDFPIVVFGGDLSLKPSFRWCTRSRIFGHVLTRNSDTVDIKFGRFSEQPNPRFRWGLRFDKYNQSPHQSPLGEKMFHNLTSKFAKKRKNVS